MAIVVYTDPYCSINAVALSDHVKEVGLDIGAEMLDASAGGDTTRENIAGLKTWTLTVTFNQDFAAANVDATLFPLIGAAAFNVETRPTTAARSATNPGYNGNAVLESYGALRGPHGQLLQTQATFRSAGALTRSTA